MGGVMTVIASTILMREFLSTVPEVMAITGPQRLSWRERAWKFVLSWRCKKCLGTKKVATGCDEILMEWEACGRCRSV